VNYIVTRTSLTIQTVTLPWQVPFPIMKSRRRKKLEKQFASFTGPTFDADLYSDNDKASCYPSIPATEEEEEEDNLHEASRRNNSSFFVPIVNPNDDVFSTSRRIIDREDDYRRRRLNRILSPDRHDAFAAAGAKTLDPSVRTYADIMRDEALKREKEETLRAISKKKKKKEEE
jgi:splicing factor 3B subunit 1